MPSDPIPRRRRVRKLPRLAWCTALLFLSTATCVPAQTTPAAAALVAPPPGLPAALGTATSVDAALQVLGAGKPEVSSHLLLEIPQIAAPGRVSARARSTLPATGALILLRGRPTPVPVPGAPPVPAAPAAGPAASPGPALVAALLVRSGQEASMNVRIDIDRTQSLTLLTYAQGRWFQTTREVKVGKPKGEVRH